MSPTPYRMMIHGAFRNWICFKSMTGRLRRARQPWLSSAGNEVFVKAWVVFLMNKQAAFGRVSNLGIWWNSLSWKSHIPNLNQFDSLDALAFYRRGWKLKPSNLECSVPRAGRDTVNKKSKHGSLEWIDIYRIEIRLVLLSPCQRARSACDNLWLASPTWWSCWCMFFNRIIYLSPKNHVSVKNGCISNRSVTFQIFRPIFHWNHDISWFMGERVVSSYTRVKVNGTRTRLTMHYSIGLY